MKVLMYGWEFPPHINGGLGVACYGIVKSLLTLDVKVSMVLPQRNQEDNQQLNFDNKIFSIDDIAFTHLPVNSRLLSYPEMNSYFESRDKLLRISPTYQLMKEVLEYAEKAGRKAHSISHDIIHAHDWLSALAGVNAKFISKKPLVIHIHALELDRSGYFYNQDIYDIEKYTLEHADKIIAVSHYTKNKISQDYGINADKIEVVHNGIFENQIKERSLLVDKNNYVLFLGRVTYQKGPFYFLQAAEKLLSICPDVEFFMSGNGDQWHDAITFVARKKLSNRIHFTGFLDPKEVDSIFSIAKVYVMPSVSEPFGLTSLEAIANNVPIIVSKQAGIRELFPKVLSVDFWDTDKLANLIHGLLTYKPLAVKQLQEAREILPNFTWFNVANKIQIIYQDLIGG